MGVRGVLLTPGNGVNHPGVPRTVQNVYNTNVSNPDLEGRLGWGVVGSKDDCLEEVAQV